MNSNQVVKDGFLVSCPSELKLNNAGQQKIFLSAIQTIDALFDLIKHTDSKFILRIILIRQNF